MKDYEAIARQHNAAIGEYMKQLEAEYGSEVPVRLWFEINQKIRDQHFFDKGLPIVQEARRNGVDLKINAQDGSICYADGREVR